jgi:hypothetical protein
MLEGATSNFSLYRQTKGLRLGSVSEQRGKWRVYDISLTGKEGRKLGLDFGELLEAKEKREKHNKVVLGCGGCI